MCTAVGAPSCDALELSAASVSIEQRSDVRQKQDANYSPCQNVHRPNSPEQTNDKLKLYEYSVNSRGRKGEVDDGSRQVIMPRPEAISYFGAGGGRDCRFTDLHQLP